jgi:hypothetical protein
VNNELLEAAFSKKLFWLTLVLIVTARCAPASKVRIMSTSYVQFSPLSQSGKTLAPGAPLTDAAGDSWSTVEAPGYDQTLAGELAAAQQNGTSAQISLPAADDSVALQIEASHLSGGIIQVEVATYDDDGRLTSDDVMWGTLTSDLVTTSGENASVDTLGLTVLSYRASTTTYDTNGNPTTSVSSYTTSKSPGLVPTSSAAPSTSATPTAAAAGDDWDQKPDTYLVITPTQSGGPLQNENGASVSNSQAQLGPDIDSPTKSPNSLLETQDFNYQLTTVNGKEAVTAAFSMLADHNSPTLLDATAQGTVLSKVELYQLQGSDEGSQKLASDTLLTSLKIVSDTIHAGEDGDTRSYQLQSAGSLEELHNDTSQTETKETTQVTVPTVVPPASSPPVATTPSEYADFEATIVVGSGSNAISAPVVAADFTFGDNGSATETPLTLTFDDPSDSDVINALEATGYKSVQVELFKGDGKVYSSTPFDTLKFVTNSVLAPVSTDDQNQTTLGLQVVEFGETYAQPKTQTESAGDDDSGSWDRVENDPNFEPACYCPGTMILTDQGEVAVELLAIGDRLITGSGEAKAIRWIGRRAYQGRFIAGSRQLLPVCVKAGAMGEGLPRRDLWVSPNHAMVVDGCLVPAGALVNGVSVVQAGDIAEVRYFHLELDQHSIIFAEGAASESFVDDDSRGMFQNAHSFAELYPKACYTPAVYCLPRVEDGEALERLRAIVDGHAGLTHVSPAAPPLTGHLDRAEDGLVEGWAQALGHPEAPVCLEVLVDGEVAATVLANRHRADLEAAGLGSGRHAFSVALPLTLGAQVQVRRALDGAVLPQADSRDRAA